MYQLSRDNKLFAFSLMLWGFGEGLFLYIEPLYLKELGSDPITIGTALSNAYLAMTITHIPAGYLADRVGRRVLIVIGFGLGAVAALVMYFAQDLWVFVAALAAYSFTGFVIAPINAYVAEARGPQSIQRALTLVFAGFWAGTIFSPALGGWIGTQYGLRNVYLIAFVAFLLSTVVIFFTRSQPIVPAATGATRYSALFRNRAFIRYLALAFCALLAMQIGLPFMPNFVEEVRGFDVAVIGLLGSINSIATVIFNATLGHRSPRGAFLAGQMLIGLSMTFMLALAGWPGILLAYALRPGAQLAHTMTAAQAGQLVNPAESGLAYGITETAVGLAAIIGPLLAGPLYDFNPHWPFQVSVAFTVVMLPLVAWLAPKARRPVEVSERVMEQAL
ncbi:MAG: MFS transporter [Anaerolineales bacterium]|nr:MFS transporter [Anaerolineales bacterium]